MKFARLLVRNMAQFRRELEQENAIRVKAGETAARVEGFRLRGLLKSELSQGQAGGVRFAPLSIIARTMKLQGRKPQRSNARKPLARLAMAVRYRTVKGRDGSTLVQVGFVDSGSGAKLSKKWVYLGFVHQEGGEIPLSDRSRAAIMKRAISLVKGRDEAARFFFLKKTTSSVRLPRRAIIDPFWVRHGGQAARNIEANFNRKLAGERI